MVEIGMVGKEGFMGASVVLGMGVAAHDAIGPNCR